MKIVMQPLRKVFSWLFCCFLLCLFVSACGSKNNPEKIAENYLYRLNNSLDAQRDLDVFSAQLKSSLVDLPRYPKRIDLRHAIPQSKINLVEFLKLSTCDLQRHIGQRNSSLGKFQKDSQRLSYEMQFIVLAEQCIAVLKPDDELADILKESVQQKRDYLSLLFWNASFASDEFAQLFSLSGAYLPAGVNAKGAGALFLALEHLEHMALNDPQSLETFEQDLAVIASSHYLGDLRRSMALMRVTLAMADQLLESRLGDRPLCLQRANNRQSNIVENVFRKYYIGQIQTYIAYVYQQLKQSMVPIDTIVNRRQAPPAFLSFWDDVYRGPDSEWAAFNQAIQQHTKQWQMLLHQCGQLPS